MLNISNIQNLTKSSVCFRTVEGCAAFYCSLISDCTVEVLGVVYLDAELGVLRVDVRGGGEGHVEADLRQIMASALNLNAHGIILMHNHPSGNTTPSRSDKMFTRQVAIAMEAIDVTVLDHIIVCPSEEYSSFRRLGFL